ncbi:MAG: hypothetical protein HY923_01060 [Elusimicrobia bacterium]|nr:hypothetical protein [Elusimicrobiota bacterium]
MMTMSPLDASRRKLLASIIRQVLSPAQLTMVHELLAAERPGRPAPQAEDIMFWMRLNMPVASDRIDELLHLPE